MTVRILAGDVRSMLATLADRSIQCCVTSPPYFGLRAYLPDGHPDKGKEIGLEPTPDAYVAQMVAVFREVRRVLRDDGTLWLNLGDSYAAPGGGFHPDSPSNVAGSKQATTHAHATSAIREHITYGLRPKNLLGIPWRVAFALQADGWYLRDCVIWHKPNPMPESVRDRTTKAHEFVFMLTKKATYFYDADAIAEPAINAGRVVEYDGSQKNCETAGDPKFATRITSDRTVGDTRNARSVWTIASQPFSEWAETVRRVRVEPDAPNDGKKRTTSPDCPMHGDRAGRASSAPRGGRGAADLFRSEHNGDHPAQAPLPGSAPIETRREPGTDPQSSGSLAPACAPSASGHSSESHRTGLDPATSPACIASAQTPDHTAGTSASPERTGPNANTLANNTSSVDGSVVHPSAQTQRHSAGKIASHGSRCTCEYYVEIVEKTSHFATFPPELPERCIKAGSKPGDTILDPFGGAGTTGLVADRLGRNAILIELNPQYADMAASRIRQDAGMFAEVAAE